jgi:alkylresorcinol/alkylpyrone synthase
MFVGRRDLARLLGVFDNARVRTRHLVQPLSWYSERHAPAARNQVYRQAAVELAHRAASQALTRAEVPSRQIGAVVFVSTTGVAAPSLDTHLIQMLDLPRDVLRVPLWGLGCAGGGAGLARGSSLVRAHGRPVLVVAVETCSLTFLPSDERPANVIATSLFGDGAAAAVIAPTDDVSHPSIVAEVAHLIDDTEHVMGWDVVDEGLRVRFAPSIPRLVRDALPAIRDTCAAAAGIRPNDLRHFVLHPGGPKVLTAYREALGLSAPALEDAWAVLRDHGNMSSPTVLFVLERFLGSTRPSGQPGLLLALGPGFCAEGVVFRW